jgi:hypothetical protein
VIENSSLHLITLENAVCRHEVYISMEHGTPTISVEIEGMSRKIIFDTGSTIWILQPGASR